MLSPVATFAERVQHALDLREKNARALELVLNKRQGKKLTTTGYVHRILKQGLQPPPDVVAIIAEELGVSERWLIAGKGPIDRDGKETPTYDSLTGWAEAATEELRRGRVQGYAIRAAGRSPAFVEPTKIDADFVFAAAMFWLGHAPEEARQAAMVAEVARLKANEDNPPH